jgi:hypothetical protein
MYMLETIIHQPHHYLCGEDKASALRFVGGLLTMWQYGSFRNRCTPEGVERVRNLINYDQVAAAMDAWNENATISIRLHEIEILANNCHHDQPTVTGKNEFYAVANALDGLEGSVALFQNNCDAVALSAGFLREWTKRTSCLGFRCEEAIRQRVRQLLRENKVADAIDAWMAAKPNPSIAIHKVRVLKTDCHHENDSPCCR